MTECIRHDMKLNSIDDVLSVFGNSQRWSLDPSYCFDIFQGTTTLPNLNAESGTLRRQESYWLLHNLFRFES